MQVHNRALLSLRASLTACLHYFPSSLSAVAASSIVSLRSNAGGSAFGQPHRYRSARAAAAAEEARQEEAVFSYRARRAARFAFVTSTGKRYEVHAPYGKKLHEVALDAKIEELPMLCNGQMQCTTCHVRGDFPGVPSEAECDLLVSTPDSASDSRLACQVYVGPELEGQEILIPNYAHNRLDSTMGSIKTSEWSKYLPENFRDS